jgi:transcriptional regulator with XRE-family HTH domain
MEDRQQRKEGASCRSRGLRLPGLEVIRMREALSQRDLSKLSGISRETIYRLEGGRRTAHSSTVRKLAAALEVSPEVLARGSHPDRDVYADK